MTIELIIDLLLSLNFKVTKDNHPYYQFESIGGKTKTRIGTKYEQLLCNGQRVINMNADNIEEYIHIGVKEDGGTRTSFNGIFRSTSELLTILNCVS